MTRIHTLDIELVRPGPPHNQLLSPMMPYTVLVGDHPPITHHFEMEHRLLKHHLASLRRAAEGESVQPLASHVALQDLIGGLLHKLPLPQRRDTDWLELRFVINPRELGVLPLELAMDTARPDAPPLLVDPAQRIILTRKVRQGIAGDSTPARSPRVLFVVSAAGGPVPAQAHLHALRKAMDRILPPRPFTTLPRVGETLRILSNASLATLRHTIRTGRYTHIHILAHGRAIDTPHGPSFGVVLDPDPTSGIQSSTVASGEKLAEALIGSKTPPDLVTVCTCESGRTVDVIEPSGSLGHALHRSGIPFVVVSQFPLEHRASVTFTHRFYQSILPGEDPRLALNEARRAVYSAGGARFDWASLAAYSNLPTRFEALLPKLRQDRRELAWSTALMWADELLCRVARAPGGCWEQPLHNNDGAPIGRESLSVVVARVEDRLSHVIHSLRAELNTPPPMAPSPTRTNLEHERILERSDRARAAIQTLHLKLWRARLQMLLGDAHLRLSELLQTTAEPRPSGEGVGMVARQTKAAHHRRCARDAYARSAQPEVQASVWGRTQLAILEDRPIDAALEHVLDAAYPQGMPLPTAKASLAAGLHQALSQHRPELLVRSVERLLGPDSFDDGDIQELWWVLDRILREHEQRHPQDGLRRIPWWEADGLNPTTRSLLAPAWPALLRFKDRVGPRPHHNPSVVP